jgi:hypothetical protein
MKGNGSAFPRKIQLLFVAFAALCCALVIGCDSSHSPAGTGAVSLPWDSTALFGYDYFSKDVFTQAVSSAGTGYEFISGQWQNSYGAMARFDTGDRQFIMGHDKSGYWFIQELLPTGDLGATTDSGRWDNFYRTLVGFRVSGQTYVFGQNQDTYYWFIQPIDSNGKLGKETDNHHWANPYTNIVAVETNLGTYLFGQNRRGYYFMQQILPGGKMGPVTYQGNWEFDYYPVFAFIEVNGNYYLYGQNENNHWFIQTVSPGGTLGPQTEADDWDHLYLTTVSFKVDGKTYLFGQDSGTKLFFIQEVLENGTMGDQVQSGTWENYYGFVFPFTYDSSYNTDFSNWMGDNWSVIGDKKLTEITIPGTHDSGMSTHQDCNLGIECNTVAQTHDIAGQLARGARFFDFRPYYDAGEDTWYLGHFSWESGAWMGCAGQKLEDALLDVADFYNAGHPKELTILYFSHCYVDGDYQYCANLDYEHLTDLIRTYLGDSLIHCDKCEDLQNNTVDELLKMGGVLVVMDGITYAITGDDIFSSDQFPLYNEYSNSNDLDTMRADQQAKLLLENNHWVSDTDQEIQEFLFSWTLTLSSGEVAGCCCGAASILDLAAKARPALMPELCGLLDQGVLNYPFLPNILYVDAFYEFATRSAIYLNKQYGQ